MMVTSTPRPGTTVANGMSGMGPTCSVRLIDRRTGNVHRVNGTALVIFTRRPQEAVAELLSGRNPAHWEARIDPIEARQTGGRP